MQGLGRRLVLRSMVQIKRLMTPQSSGGGSRFTARSTLVVRVFLVKIAPFQAEVRAGLTTWVSIAPSVFMKIEY